MFGLGPWELILIGVLLFLVFGAKRIPEIGKGLGGAVREFKGIKKEMQADKKDSSGTDAKEDEKQGPEPESLERKMAGKLLNRAPGVNRVMNVKKKVDQVRKIVK